MTLELPLSRTATSIRSSFVRDVLAVTERRDVLSLAGGLPPSESMATDAISRAAASILGDPTTRAAALQYGPTAGAHALRSVLGERFGIEPDGVVVTTGAQQGINLVASALVDPGDCVVIESPGYLGAIQAFEARGAALAAIPGDRDGLDVDELARRLEQGLSPRLVCVVSEFANPTGATLSSSRRSTLVGLARRYGFVIVDDNPYGGLRWTGTAPRPLAEVAATDGANDCVVSLGSASKVMSPGLRIGWMSGPAAVLDAVVRIKQSVDLHTSSFDQHIVAAVLGDDDALQDHLERVRARNQRRCATLSEALDSALASHVNFDTPDGGMFLWLRCTDPEIDTMEWFSNCVDAGVAFVPGVAFSVDQRWNNALRLCFATLSEADLVEAVRRMTTAFELTWQAKSGLRA